MNEEEKLEVNALTELMYDQLEEKIKDEVEEKINRIDLFDKLTLAALLRIPNKKLSLEPAAPTEEE